MSVEVLVTTSCYSICCWGSNNEP